MVSVHSLACGGGEIAEQLAEKATGAPFRSHILKSFPDMDVRAIKSLRNRYWNAFKHATGRDGLDRQDEELLATFSDEQNDHALFIGWYDYALAHGVLPVEVQAFQIWYYAMYPEKMRSPFDVAALHHVLGNLESKDRSAQKVALRELIEFAGRESTVVNDPKTDSRQLILP